PVAGVRGDLQAPSFSPTLFLEEVMSAHAGRLNCNKDTHRAHNESKAKAFGQFTAAEFAHLSSSMQLTLFAIHRAQLSSSKAIAATAEGSVKSRWVHLDATLFKPFSHRHPGCLRTRF